MKATHTAESILGTRSHMRVLRVLNAVGVPLNASQVASRAGISQPAALSALKELARDGLVQSSPAGRAWVHSLVRDNAYVQRMVEPVFAAEQGVVDDLLMELDRAFAPYASSVVLFGSYARGDQSSNSDIDIALVGAGPSEATELERRAADETPAFRRRFGSTLSPLIYSATEAATLWHRAPALQSSLEQDGVVVAGDAPWEWRNGDADE